MAKPKKYDPSPPKVDQVVMVRFDDHAENTDDPVECVVYGRVAKKTKRALTIEAWTCVGSDADDFDNNKRFSILRSTILRCEVLNRPVDERSSI